MLESILDARKLEKSSWKAAITGFVFTVVAVLVATQLGTSSPEFGGMGFLIVALITIPAAPFFLGLFTLEEHKISGNFISRHARILEIFAYFFIGVVIASSLCFVVLGMQKGEQYFSDQVHDLKSRNIITASATSSELDFTKIFFNNLRVLGLTILFSFLFGAGAVFLISWNASVLGVLIAKIAEAPAKYGSFAVFNNIYLDYLVALPMTLLRILPHGIFEFGGYFFGAVSGGIFSVALMREKMWSNKKQVLMDCAIYFIIAALCIFLGAIVEVSL